MIMNQGQGSEFAQKVEHFADYVFSWAVGKGFETFCRECAGTGQRHLDGSPSNQPGVPSLPCPDCDGTGSGYRNFGEQIALVHSELVELEESLGGNLDEKQKEYLLKIHKSLSKILESHRKKQHKEPDEHCPAFTSTEIEVADIIIRLMCMSGSYGWRIGRAIEAKQEFNFSRPMKHGKAY